MMKERTRILAVLEIVPDASGALPISLLSAAYRASRTGYVVLALRGVSPQAVDRALDPLIAASRSWRMNGVVYADANEASFIGSIARRTSIVLAVTDEMRATLAALGIGCAELDDTISRLRELERGPGVSVPATVHRPSEVAGGTVIS